MNKDIKRLMMRLSDQGFTYSLRASGRLLVYRDKEQIASIPTGAQGRDIRNYVARLRQAGFKA